jgi:hypothetical protein
MGMSEAKEDTDMYFIACKRPAISSPFSWKKDYTSKTMVRFNGVEAS